MAISKFAPIIAEMSKHMYLDLDRSAVRFMITKGGNYLQQQKTKKICYVKNYSLSKILDQINKIICFEIE